MAKPALGQDLLVGQTFGHYQLVERIGEGGMGIVYRARDQHFEHREVAVKILPQGALADEPARQRFRKEANALSKLSHPNIAAVIDFDSSNGVDYIAEELVDGVSLEDMLAAGPLSEAEIVSLGCQLCDGIAAAHEHGIVHRDIKPSNIGVTAQAQLKILDFGLAKTCRPLQTAGDSVTASGEQIVAGTWPYTSPEQLRNEHVDGRTDIWSAGCVLYEMATGRRPFVGQGLALFDEILHQPAASIRKFNPKLHSELDLIVHRCLEKDPAARYQSAREVVFDLHHATAGPILENSRRFRRRVPIALLAVLAVAFMTFIIMGIYNRSHIWRSLFPGHAAASTRSAAPYELYLSGMKYLERWDKAGNPDSAIALLDKAVQADPTFALGFSALGEAYWAKYRVDRDPRWFDAAEKNCRRAAELNSHLPAVYVTLARVHNGRGRHNLALQEIQQALQLEPHDPDALLGEAAVYASMGQLEKAESTYRTAAALGPQDWSGYYDLGAFYYRQHRYSDAVTAFDRALEITPDNAMVHAALGGVLQLLKRNEDAEKHLLRSIDLEPSYAAYTNLSAFYFRERRWQDSAVMSRKAIHINSADWRAWANLGLAYEWLHRPRDAQAAYRHELACLEELAKVNGDDPNVQIELGLLYSRQNRRDEAFRFLEAALTRAPNDPNVLATAVEIQENLGDRGAAIQFMTRALASGFTLAQAANDPGKQQLLLDPRIREIADKYNHPSSARQQP